jgi:hypothetical protein
MTLTTDETAKTLTVEMVAPVTAWIALRAPDNLQTLTDATAFQNATHTGMNFTKLMQEAVAAVLAVALIVAGWVYVTIRRRTQEAAAPISTTNASHNAEHPTTSLGPLEPGQDDSNQVDPTELNRSSVVVVAEPIASPKHQMRGSSAYCVSQSSASRVQRPDARRTGR